MSECETYESSSPLQRVEFTQRGMALKEEKIAARWFKRLQDKGLIPKSAGFVHRIKDYHPPDPPADSQTPVPTYKKALIAIVRELRELRLNDSDHDGLADFDLEVFTKKLEEQGIIPPRESNPELAQNALLTRKSCRQLRFYPPELTPFCQERNLIPHLSAPGFKGRFEGDPYKMPEVIKYFRKFAKDHSVPELMRELEIYLETYYAHIDETPLKGSNVSENLNLHPSSDLMAYFTLFDGRAVIDCNIFAEVANVILRGARVRELSTRFISVSYFGRERGHAALIRIDGSPRWIVNNSSVKEFNGSLDALAQLLTEDENHLVSSICTGKTLAASCQNSTTVDPKQALLHSPYATVRSNAAKYLSLNPDPTAVETLVRAALSDNNEDVRYFAILALLKTEGISGAQAELLAQNLKHESSLGIRFVLFRLLYALKKIDQEQYLQFLLATLKKAPALASFYIEHQLFGLREEPRPAGWGSLEEAPSSLVPVYTQHQLVRLIEGEGSPGYIALADVFENENQYPPLLGNIIIGRLGNQYGPDMKKVKAAGAGFTFLLEKALFRGGQAYAAFYLRELARKGNAEAAAILVKALEQPQLEAAYEVASSLSETNVASFMAPPLQERIAAALIELIRSLRDDPDLLELSSYPGALKRWHIELALEILSDIKGEKFEAPLQRYHRMHDQVRMSANQLSWPADPGPEWRKEFKKMLSEIPI